MRVGSVTERTPSERRVGLTPAGARRLVARGHEVAIEAGAGLGAGFADQDYLRAGARIVPDAEEVWAEADLLVKVKEPVGAELGWVRDGQSLFAYLHLAPDPSLARALVDSGVTAIAYETVADEAGRLPLLAPMSEIAGRLASQYGAHHLTAPHGGPGILIGGASGVRPARAVIVGGGAVGEHAAAVAAGMGAEVVVLERRLDRIRELERRFDGRIRVVAADPESLEDELSGAHLVIGAALVPGALAPKVVNREHLALLAPGAVVVDVSIDQGGCVSTSRPTTHAAPTFVVDGVLHYCVANMPGSVPLTSTRALTQATFPYVERLTELGVRGAMDADPGLAKGCNVADGRITNDEVAAAHAAG